MRSSAVALLSALTGLVGAYTTPVGEPTGNPIYKPGLGEVVPKGEPYTISWDVSKSALSKRATMDRADMRLAMVDSLRALAP